MKNEKKRYVVPRNEFVAAMRLRPSGAHVKTKKALRKADKQSLRRELRDYHGEALQGLSHGNLLLMRV